MTDGVFNMGVRLLEWLAALFGTTYEAVNVWLFCVIWPLITAALVVAVITLSIRNRELQHNLCRQQPDQE